MEKVDKRLKFSKEDIIYIKQNYLTYSYKDIGVFLRRNAKSIAYKVRNLGLPKKGSGNHYNKSKYDVQHDYFSTWSSNMAYILGFITADGHIDDNKRFRLVFGLAKKDVSILNFIKNELCPNKQIGYRKIKVRNKYHDIVTFDVSSKRIISDLQRLGITRRKTSNEILPSIPKKYSGDYLRGLFDGDGCLSYVRRSRIINGRKYFSNDFKFSIVSKSEQFLKSVKNELGLQIGSVKFCKNSYTGLYTWSTSDKQLISKLGQHIYKKNEFCLIRKREKFNLLWEIIKKSKSSECREKRGAERTH